MKFKNLFESDRAMILGGLTVARCNIATVNTEHDDVRGKKKDFLKTQYCNKTNKQNNRLSLPKISLKYF